MKRITKIEQDNANALMPKLRVAAYCRVSTASDDQLVSLGRRKRIMNPISRQTRNGVCRRLL